MKKIPAIIVLFLCMFTSYSQIAYYDAIQLSKLLDAKQHFKNSAQQKDSLFSILSNYLGNGIESPSDFMDSLNNPFLYLYFDKAQTYSIRFNKNVTSKIASSIGGLDVTNFSKGISLFLIDRAKQELNIAFFDKFKKFTEENPEIRILFPNTSNSLRNLLAYQYSQMLPVLREAFYKDLNILPDNLVEVMLMDKYYNKMKEFPEFLVVLRSITLLQQINQMNPPQLIDSLHGIAKDFERFPELENLYNSLQLTTIFSNAIRSDSIHYEDSLKNFWISSEEFYKNIMSDSNTLNIFLGLIYQKINTDSITINGKMMATLIQKNKKEIVWYKIQLSKLITQIESITSAAKSIKKLKDEGVKPSNQDIYTYVNTTIDLFEFGYDFASHYNPELKTDKLDKYIDLTKNANNLYINTVSHNYTLAMNNAVFVLNSISKDFEKKDTAFKKSIFNRNSNLISGITTYGTFIANMVDADTPEEVQAAIENAALPAGSSSFKKNYKHNLALNAYLGVNAGNWPKDNSTSSTWNSNFRLTAPIGVTWTPFSYGKCGALSVFVPVIDVGAIVNYQLNSDSTEVDQKIYLANIFSPGGYLVYGMAWNLPISVGFGGQYGPGLVKMGEDIWSPSWRWNFFLAVDIPIFNLNKGRGITSKD